MGLRMEWDINSEMKVDIATFTIPLALARNLGLRNRNESYKNHKPDRFSDSAEGRPQSHQPALKMRI